MNQSHKDVQNRYIKGRFELLVVGEEKPPFKEVMVFHSIFNNSYRLILVWKLEGRRSTQSPGWGLAQTVLNEREEAGGHSTWSI